MIKNNTRVKKSQQWLNIVIILISAMLLLSVFVGRMISNTVEDNPRKEQTVKLERIDFGEVQFNLDNNQWISSSLGISQAQIELIARNWEMLLARQGEPLRTSSSAGQTVLLYLSGISQPVVAKISLVKDKLLISFITAQLEISLPDADYQDYFPHQPKLN